MSKKLRFGTNIVTIPDQGASPAWGEGVVDAFVAIQLQLQGIVSAFDIAPSVQLLTTDTNSFLNVNSAAFPSGSVRSFVFSYAIYRTNGVIALAEDGTVSAVFNTLTSTWNLQHEFNGVRQASGTPYHTFNMSGDQLQISTFPIGGSYDSVNSKLSYAAKTVLTSDF